MRAFVTAIRPSLVHDVTDPKAGDAGWELNTGISSLARLAFRSLQMTEALGEPPALAALRDQFSNAQTIRLRNEDYRPVSILGDDPELAWSRFQTAIGDALSGLARIFGDVFMRPEPVRRRRAPQGGRAAAQGRPA